MAAFRAVVVGCGAMSKGWLRAVAENPDLAGRISVVGLVDLDAGRAQALADEFGLSRGDDRRRSRRDARRRRSPTSSSTSSCRRRAAAWSRRRCRHGCHVLSEKPMAASMDEARALVALAARGRAGACGRPEPPLHSGRAAHPAADRERRARASSPALHCDFFIGAHFGGFREEMEHVLLLDMAIHTFDAAALHVGTDAARGLLPRDQPARAPGTRMAPRPMRSSNSTATWSSPIAARGAPRAPTPAGRARWRIIGTQGHAALGRRRRLRGARRRPATRASSAPLEPVDVPELGRRRGRPTATPASSRDFLDAIETRHARPRPSAPTTSRASPWCSARSRAPRPASA